MRILPLVILCLSLFGCDLKSLVFTQSHQTEMEPFLPSLSLSITLFEPRDGVRAVEEFVLYGTDDQSIWPALHPEIKAMDMERIPFLTVNKNVYSVSLSHGPALQNINEDTTVSMLSNEIPRQRYEVTEAIDVPMVKEGRRRSIIWRVFREEKRTNAIPLTFQYYPHDNYKTKDYIAEANVECKLVLQNVKKEALQKSKVEIPTEVPCKKASNTVMYAAPTFVTILNFENDDDFYQSRQIWDAWRMGEWYLHLSFDTLPVPGELQS